MIAFGPVKELCWKAVVRERLWLAVTQKVVLKAFASALALRPRID
jgi:hypothetical protein